MDRMTLPAKLFLQHQSTVPHVFCIVQGDAIPKERCMGSTTEMHQVLLTA